MGDNVATQTPEEEAPFPLTDVDKWVLSQTDEEFKKHDWEDLKQIIGMFPGMMTGIKDATRSVANTCR